MKKTSSLLIGAAVSILCLSAASPSFAAALSPSAGSRAGDVCGENPDIPPYGDVDPTITMSDYNPATHVATVSGVAQYGLKVKVNHLDSTGRTVDSYGLPLQQIDYGTCTYTVTMNEVFAGDTFRVDVQSGGTVVSASAETPGAVPEPKATVSTTTKDGVVRGTFTFARSGLIEIRDADGKSIGGSRFADNWNAPEGTPFVYSFSLPDTGRTSTFTAAASYAFVDHTVAPFTINPGMTSAVPSAPSVDTAAPTDAASPSTVVTVHGEARAVVTVKDAKGKAIAVKSLGTSGSAQIALTRSSGAASYTVSQRAGGATSPSKVFTI